MSCYACPTSQFVNLRSMWTKICGIRDSETASFVASQGADAIGLNFYAPSPRSVTVDQAAAIASSVRGSITVVGLFVNHSPEEVHRISRQVGCDMLQFHGDEPPEFLAEFPEAHIIRAFRLGPDGLAPIADYLQRCRALNAMPWACLIDAAVMGQYGGSGVVLDWHQLAIDYHGGWPPMILAGGLTPANVAEAIRVAQPWGVDVASGVESAKGIKDRHLIQQFLKQARTVGP